MIKSNEVKNANLFDLVAQMPTSNVSLNADNLLLEGQFNSYEGTSSESMFDGLLYWLEVLGSVWCSL